jgi:hypothetical protein
MGPMLAPAFAPLVHVVGFITGAALYGLLFAVAIRRRDRRDYLPLLTAALGLTWNVSGLVTIALRDFAAREPSAWLLATAYSALGFLPAVVVHSVLRRQAGQRMARPSAAVVGAAYAVSLTAETLMYWNARTGGAPPALALQILTWSFLTLAFPVLLLTRRQRGRGWSVVALAVFAISALHLSRHDGTPGSLAAEIVGHHASILLIFAILYQDFRFALADVFLKRALTLFATIAIAAALYLGVAVPVFNAHDFHADPVAVGVAVMLWTATAVLYPRLARSAAWLVDRVVLRRPSYAVIRETLAAEVAAAQTPEDVLNVVCRTMRAALAAEAMTWTEGDGDVPIATADPPRYALNVGPLASGRDLLSDDLALLEAAAVIAARRLDALRLAQVSRLATEAELRALRAQVNPHFLFNALNTIGFLIQTAPPRAQVTLRKLTTLLRGVLRSGESAVTLGEELDLVSAYLDIESARFEERLEVQVDVPPSLRTARVPPLVLQPLVENAIKHGISRSRTGGEVRIEARRTVGYLLLSVTNTGAAATEFEIAQGRRRGLGLSNIEQRLRHQYGESARLTLSSGAAGTIAEVSIPVAAEQSA